MTNDDVRARFNEITSGEELAELRKLNPPIVAGGVARRVGRFVRRNWVFLLAVVVIAAVATSSCFT